MEKLQDGVQAKSTPTAPPLSEPLEEKKQIAVLLNPINYAERNKMGMRSIHCNIYP
jgi:hypothetical protein